MIRCRPVNHPEGAPRGAQPYRLRALPGAPLTITRAARLFGLSRSTLLYYDAVGLLRPRARSASGYRLYTATDRAVLGKIALFRSLGVPLAMIRDGLQGPGSAESAVLLRQLFELSGQVARLNSQQRRILELLEADGSLRGAKARLPRMKRLGMRAGITGGNASQLHRALEQTAPALHDRLLGFLGFSEREKKEFIRGLKAR
jgi:MerR family transcriptional regulator, thiopeptide resistance regulator